MMLWHITGMQLTSQTVGINVVCGKVCPFTGIYIYSYSFPYLTLIKGACTDQDLQRYPPTYSKLNIIYYVTGPAKTGHEGKTTSHTITDHI